MPAEGGGYSPVPRLSFAHRFDTKLREMSFEKQNSAKAVLFTMYVSTAGAKTFYHRKTYVRIIIKLLTVKTAFTEF